jgi:hypothetical protein
MTIDPGIAGSGFAVWDKFQWDLMMTSNIGYKSSNLIFKPPMIHLVKKFNTDFKYMLFLQTFIKALNIKRIYCEKPKFMGMGSAKGHMVAVKGDLITLAIFVGSLKATALLNHVPMYMVEISEWKGTLSKEIVNEKILTLWPGCKAKSHDWDAIGIGLYLLGLINNPHRKGFNHVI